MECVSPHLPTPCESQSSLRPWITPQLICQAAHFKRPDWLCCSPQRDCFGASIVPKGGELGMWQIETWALGDVFLFLFWSDVCADRKLQSSPLQPLMWFFLKSCHLIGMLFLFFLLCWFTHLTYKHRCLSFRFILLTYPSCHIGWCFKLKACMLLGWEHILSLTSTSLKSKAWYDELSQVGCAVLLSFIALKVSRI